MRALTLWAPQEAATKASWEQNSAKWVPLPGRLPDLWTQSPNSASSGCVASWRGVAAARHRSDQDLRRKDSPPTPQKALPYQRWCGRWPASRPYAHLRSVMGSAQEIA